MSEIYKKCDNCERWVLGCELDGTYRRWCIKMNYRWFRPKDVEAYLQSLADELEPKTHCCECTPGNHFCMHMVHIQYPDCDCDPAKYILKRNDDGEKV